MFVRYNYRFRVLRCLSISILIILTKTVRNEVILSCPALVKFTDQMSTSLKTFKLLLSHDKIFNENYFILKDKLVHLSPFL